MCLGAADAIMKAVGPPSSNDTNETASLAARASADPRMHTARAFHTQTSACPIPFERMHPQAGLCQV